MAEEVELSEASLDFIEETTVDSLLASLSLEEDGQELLTGLVEEGVITQEQLDRWLASRQPNPDQP